MSAYRSTCATTVFLPGDRPIGVSVSGQLKIPTDTLMRLRGSAQGCSSKVPTWLVVRYVVS
jgi:hypothetical protein